MSQRTVTTQQELAAAIADGVADIVVDSPSHVVLDVTEVPTTSTLIVRGSSSPSMEAGGSSSPSMVAWDSSSPRMVAWDSSSPSMEARGSSSPSMEAWDSSSPSMVAWDSSSPRMVAWGSSSPSMEAGGSSSPSMVAWGSSSPRMVARDSSSPRMVAWGSSSPSMVAWDSSSPSTVQASGMARVALTGPLSIVAGAYVAVTLLDGKPTVVEGTHVIRPPDLTGAAAWCDFHGVTVADGKATLFKGTEGGFRSPHGTVYEPGTTVEAPDWHDRPTCGGGLHLSPTPMHSERYIDAPSHYLAVEVEVADLVVVTEMSPPGGPDKVKVRSCRVLREVDRHGDPVEAAS